jgi:tRNA U34 5-methylaminomethyl-2-thiouridine-forming methyltransferase MnmC
MERHLIRTGDGSHSFYVPELDEHYHSTYGAIQESSHIFINKGLLAVDRGLQELRVLEVGFGTGLNALLTWEAGLQNNMNIRYTAMEPWPLEQGQAMQLNYPGLLKTPGAQLVFRALHEAAWGMDVSIDGHMKILKMQSRLEDALLAPDRFHLVYFDAFGPDAQPELWTEEIFNMIFTCMATHGIMTTFSAKGSVRRALKNVGFDVESLEGPPGKRSMTRARKGGFV